MDATRMSLDEIIKKKKKPRYVTSTPKSRTGGKAPGQGAVTKKTKLARVIDARDIICSKQRYKIGDARDRLNEIMRRSDARVKLQQRVQETSRTTAANGGGAGGRRNMMSGAPHRNAQQGKSMQTSLRSHRNASNKHKQIDISIEHVELSKAERMMIAGKRNPPPLPINPQSLKRTVHNEVYSLPTSMPPLPRFRSVRSHPDAPTSPVDWSDPFQLYDMRLTRPNLHPPPGSMVYEPAVPTARPPPRGILRNRSRSPPPRAPASTHALDHPHLSTSMRARLERTPNPSESMGIFAKLPPDEHPYTSQHKYTHCKPVPAKPSSTSVNYRGHSPAPPSPPTMGYRIIVSNLHSNVIQQDIQELFEDIGDLIEARLVRPGVAEVIYRTLKDAEKAVDAYHNRQLDGQPMNCLLVHPRASNKPTAPAIKYGR